MRPDDEICLCFHVTRRKVENFLRVERPQRVGQLMRVFRGWEPGVVGAVRSCVGCSKRR